MYSLPSAAWSTDLIRSQHLSELFCSAKWNAKHSTVNGPKKMPRQLFKGGISRSHCSLLIPSSLENDLFAHCPSSDLTSIFSCSVLGYLVYEFFISLVKYLEVNQQLFR